ncbi:SURF1-like protein [Thalassotalea insulae]|uniref:SURF1-like protein n=1 Tax=Thalassotalea insulae TaxID=2056778 RepID=A0ABQ6GRY7_9GAMM|nr:SURF1 family protein [Thalassotalea insulae]GLX78708.1 SURF1-like protein [Thalassotalea insulae]
MQFINVKDYFRQLNWFVVAITLLVFCGLIKLGLWQSSRALEKEQRLARIAQYQTQQAIELQQLLALSKSEKQLNDLPVRLTGNFEPDKVFLLDNQTNQGRLGYRVLQILHTDQGAVLVNLGWVEGFIDRNQLPSVTPLVGLHQVRGNIRIPEQGVILAEQDYSSVRWPFRIQQIELVKISQLIAEKLLPFVIYLDTNETIGYEKNWRPIVMPPEKHRAYAFQWFSLATAWLVLILSASVWFYNNNKNEGSICRRS